MALVAYVETMAEYFVSGYLVVAWFCFGIYPAPYAKQPWWVSLFPTPASFFIVLTLIIACVKSGYPNHPKPFVPKVTPFLQSWQVGWTKEWHWWCMLCREGEVVTKIIPLLWSIITWRACCCIVRGSGHASTCISFRQKRKQLLSFGKRVRQESCWGCCPWWFLHVMLFCQRGVHSGGM